MAGKRGRPSKSATLKQLTDLGPSEDIDHDLTDGQLLSDIQDRYKMMSKLGRGAISGAVRGVVVSAKPGVGKTFELERLLSEKANSSRKFSFEHLKGTISPINLYKKLYDYGRKGSVLLIDDCDDIFFDPTSLNLLKAALDSSTVRKIGWHTESAALKDGAEQVYPTSFDFEGSVIFITNLNFQSAIDSGKQKKIVPHLEALMSRSLYLDLKLDSLRSVAIWVDYLVNTKDILVKEFGLTKTEQRECTDWVRENATGMRTLSIRDALKVGSLYASDRKHWKDSCEMLLLK